MKKYISLMTFVLLAVFSLALLSCSEDDADKKSNTADYNVKLPNGNSDVTIEPLSDEEVDRLKAQGYDIIGTPVNVTKEGEKHVVLDEPATVSFKIPSDFPKDQYNELVGVLISDDGVEYVVPDIYGLRKGVVRFQTYHFSKAAAAKDKEELKKKFIEYTAVNGWNADLREKDFNKLGDQIKDIADQAGLGENDLLGIAFREVLGDNDYVKKTMEYVNAYDEGNLTDKAINDISEKLDKEINAKVLSVLFGKLKTDPDNAAVKDFLKEHLNQENMEDVGKRLGEGQSPATIAWEYGQGFVIERLKEFSVKQVPYIKAVQATAKAVKIGMKFWGNQKNLMLYSQYEALCNENHGVLDGNKWNDLIAWQLSNPKTLYGMSLDEVREQFEKRYNDKVKIDKKKAEIQKLVDLWTTDNGGTTDILVDNDKYFGENCDYIMRLTRLHELMERFRKELVVDGALKGLTNANTINKELAIVMDKYMEMYASDDPKYDMPRDFYKWLAKNDYLDKKIQKQVDNLNGTRSWYLIRTDINCHDATTGNAGAYMNYSATATAHSKKGMVWGIVGIYDDKELFPVGFEATVDAPPALIQGGDSIVLHATVKRTTDEATCFVYETPWITFEDEDIGPNFVSDWAVEGKVINLTGSKTVGTRPGSATSGSWDFVLRIPKGSKKNQLRAINYHACDSRTHWVYRWCSIFEKDEPIE